MKHSILLLVCFLFGSIFSQTAYEDFEADTLTFSASYDYVSGGDPSFPEDVLNDMRNAKNKILFCKLVIEVSRHQDTVEIMNTSEWNNYGYIKLRRKGRMISQDLPFSEYFRDDSIFVETKIEFGSLELKRYYVYIQTFFPEYGFDKSKPYSSFSFNVIKNNFEYNPNINLLSIMNEEYKISSSWTFITDGCIATGKVSLTDISPTPPALSVADKQLKVRMNNIGKDYDLLGRSFIGGKMKKVRW